MHKARINRRSGPLRHLRILEFGGIGPGPLCGMLLSDMGAVVLRVDRQVPAGLGVPRATDFDVQRRGRPSLSIDLKHPRAAALILRLIENADAVLDPFRPGVLEKLGLGPQTLMERNSRLVIIRITGWGQTGPLAQCAGHDINYLSITGCLHAIGPKNGRPCPPLNLVADMGAGAMFSAFGTLAGIMHARETGRGQVVDSAMCDGSAYLAAGMFGLCAEGKYTEERESNLLDGGAPFYATYATRDGKYMAIGAIERKFFDLAMSGLGIDGGQWPDYMNPACWPEMATQFRHAFARKSRKEWCEAFEGSDACVSPVLSFKEAVSHPHNVERANLTMFGGVVQPAPTPVFSESPGAIQCPPPRPGADSEGALLDWGITADEVRDFAATGMIGPK